LFYRVNIGRKKISRRYVRAADAIGIDASGAGFLCYSPPPSRQDRDMLNIKVGLVVSGGSTKKMISPLVWHSFSLIG